MTTTNFLPSHGTSALLSFRLRYLGLLLFLLGGVFGNLQAQCTFAELYEVLEYGDQGVYCPPITTVSGNITDSDPAFTRCGSSGDFYYETFTFRVDITDVYTFDMPNIGPPTGGVDFFFALYSGALNAAFPCISLLEEDDDDGSGNEPRISRALTPGVYTMVTTTFGSEDEDGAYSYNISSVGDGQVFTCNTANPVTSLEESIPLELGMEVDIATSMLINICFTGDISSSTELMRVTISDEVFTIGDLGYVPGSLLQGPYCRDFVITDIMAIQDDLADGGDINVTVAPVGSGWSSNEPFGFSVTEIKFDFNVDVLTFDVPAPGDLSTYNEQEDVLILCKADGSYDFEITGEEDEEDPPFRINPMGVIPAVEDNPDTSEDESRAEIDFFDEATGVLNLSIAPTGIYSILYRTNVNGCAIDAIQRVVVLDVPVANIKPTLLNCKKVGERVNLAIMYDDRFPAQGGQGTNTRGGIFEVVGRPDLVEQRMVDHDNNDNTPEVPDGYDFVVPEGGGCFDVLYVVLADLTDDIRCNDVLQFSTAKLMVRTTPEPSFTISTTETESVLDENNMPMDVLVDLTSPVCSSLGSIVVDVAGFSSGPNQEFTIIGNGGTIDGDVLEGSMSLTVENSSFSLVGPSSQGVFSYTFCLEEANSPPTDCAETYAQEDDPSTDDVDESLIPLSIRDCAQRKCQTITIFNDGNDCSATPAFFNSECVPDFDATEVCEVEVKNNLTLECVIIELNGPQLIEAEITNFPAVAFCSDDEIAFDWQGSLAGALGDAATSGPTISELAPPVSGIVCDIITFEFCIPLVVTDICIDPLPLGPFEDACDQTVGQFVFSTLGALLGRANNAANNPSEPDDEGDGDGGDGDNGDGDNGGGDNGDGDNGDGDDEEPSAEEDEGDGLDYGGGSGLIVADTDGDGNFDFVVTEYGFPMRGRDTIPNNVEGHGTITIRNVVAWPFNSSDVCGEVSGESINLLDILPIAAIPIVGVIIEDVLAAASCNVELVFTDAVTLEIPVFNNSEPEFVNNNTDPYMPDPDNPNDPDPNIDNGNPRTGYVFSENGVCDAEANWSIPLAYDGCDGGLLQYIGFTEYLTPIDLNGDGNAEDVSPESARYADPANAPAPVMVLESGVYQIGGPLPGTDLPVGSYLVTYAAYSCAGVQSTYSFPVEVTSGDPILECPGNTFVKSDVDRCDAVVTGISVRQGASCASIINYSIINPDGTTGPAMNTPWNIDSVGTHHDASGVIFQAGTSIVEYTMAIDIDGNGTIDDMTERDTCSFEVTVYDVQEPIAHCRDVDVRLENDGEVTVFAVNPTPGVSGAAFVDGGSTDNCAIESILIAKPGGVFAESLEYVCSEVGYHLVNLEVRDTSGNSKTCIAQIQIQDFFDDIQFDLDAPEICLEANNPEQLDFSNYLVITLPNDDVTPTGPNNVINHHDVATNDYLGLARGGFGITAFAPSPGSASNDPGSITADGVYTPGTGSGYVTISYLLAFPGAVDDPFVTNGYIQMSGCVEMVHSTFELRQPLDMESPECECIVQNDRIVNLGEVTGGLEPYTIQYSGVQLDVDNDQIADDVDGSFTYDGTYMGSAGTVVNYNIDNFTEDLGNLLVDYTQPTWSFTIVDARGCEIFRSGSCDNDDDTGGPMIDCTALGAVTLYTRNEPICEVQDTWVHTLPTDNCDVILYTYTIENPDGTIAGPFDISALLNPDITNPLPDQFVGEYDFQHHSPTENVTTITYYAEDAVGNFTQCDFTVTVIDDDPPRFINCPEPAVIVDAPPTWCAAFANYSLPLAEDNCGSVVVTQIDDTGLTSGSLFPVGITINTYEAVDETGNTITCDVKIIVNDFHTPPTIECPDNVEQDNDEGDCGAVVMDIAPSGITDNCPENLTVVYRIDDEDGNEVASGFDDASGNYFELGTNTVSYSIQDMPLLLITEVTHELSNTVDGTPVTTPSCFDGIQNGDETDVDCGGGVCTSCSCPNNEVVVEIVLDDNPEETTWAITEPNNGAVLASGGPYAAGLAGTTVTQSICLSDDCYDFVIRDAGLDGIAASGGSYTVTTGDDVVAAGASFGTREVTNFCLDGTPPAGSLVGTAGSRDAVEITNFGSANLDVSCLMIERAYASGSETYAVPTGAVLAPGGVLTIHFGDGHDDPANNVFYVPGTTDLDIDEPTAYVLSLSRSILDVAVMNGFDVSSVLVLPAYELGGLTVADYWSGGVGPVYGGGIVRTTVWDTDSAADFAPGEACLPITIGSLNPGLAQPSSNGASTAIQAQPTVRVECDFTVAISDDEDAVCGLYGEWNDYASGAINVAYGECIETIYSIGEAYTVSDVNLNIAGLAGDMGNLTFTLISPEGTEVELAAAVCAGTNEVEFTFDGDFGPAIDDAAGCGILNNAGDLVMPVGDIEIFNGEAAAGDWILQIGHNGQQNTAPAAFASSILFVSSREAYPDYTITLENDLGVCGADYTWNHAILFDNCQGGTILWTIVDSSGTTLESQAIPIFPENTEVTFFFPVGISTVTYALTDANGNTSSCSFDVTVDDTEDPVIVCPEDVTIQLDGGECERSYRPTPADYTAIDNCAVVDIYGDPPFGQPLPIGVNPVDFTVVDAAGNDTTCTYFVTILEYIPDNPQMACIDQINIHLNGDCQQVILPSMVLAGREYYCFDNYVLTLLQRNEEGTFDTISPNVVGVDQIGEEIRYQIYDPRNDISCWGNIDVGFFEAPEFICPPNATVSCNASTDTSLMGVPILESCALAGATIAYADTLQRNDACDDPRAILRRTWHVTDAYGNEASCVQTITIEAFDLSTVNFPANRDGDASPAVYCADAAADPTLTDPENTGFPFVDDGSDIFTTNFCSASYLYSDEVYNICAGSYEILRTWKVRNTCQPVIPGVNPIEAVQIIRVLDFENPALTCPDDVSISTSSIDCNGAYLIPEPVVETGCTNWEYTVSASNGDLSQLPNGTYLLSGLDEGVYTIRYEVEDECGRYSECIFNLTVLDQVGPTAACEDGVNVSLDGNGTAVISTADIDGNSEDLCGEVSLAMRRLYEFDASSCDPVTPFYTEWDASVGVSCCDLQDLVTVELQVTDEDGNSSICWTEILVEDKIAPTCIAPNDVTITCVEYTESLPNDIAEATEAQLDALFGFAGGADNCSVTVTQTISGNINNCGVGQLVRVFTATDGGGLTNGPACTQTIDIVSVFDYQVVFPADASGTCAEIPSYDDLAFTDFGCDLLTVTTNVDTLRTLEAGEECFKLRVTYDAVNWCEHNSLGEPYLLPRDGHNGRDPETEALYLNVKPGTDINDASDDFAFLSRFSDRSFNSNAPQSDRMVDDGNDIDGTDDGNGETDSQAYAQDDSRGAFQYVQYIKVYDEVAPVITVTEPAECFTGNGDNCTAVVIINFTAADECSAAQVTAELDVDYDETLGFQPSRSLTAAELTIDVTGTYVIRINEALVGSHAIRIHANDGCGNSDNAILEFCVSPDRAPTPICIQTLTVTLTDDGEGGGIAAIWASDFIASDITDCFGNEIDVYSLYAEEEASAGGFLLEENHLGVMITCDELAASNNNGYPVRLYAFDAAGNSDYCTVFVEIQQGVSSPCDNGGEAGDLAGIITDAEMNAIEGVTVSITSSAGMNSEMVTAAEGTFRFSDIPLDQDYTISPTHFEDYLNGVRTSDIVAITGHILSTQTLGNTLQMLAADVDGNASIDVGDIISIRRLILGQSDVFPGDMPSWMFIPAEYEFPVTLNPWSAAFPTVINHNDLAGNVLDADFVGVKIGDVNQTARPNSLVSGAPRSLIGSLDLEMDEIALQQGETYSVPVYASALTEVDGYQFTLEFDQSILDVTRIESGLVTAGNFGWTFAERGLITTSWNWANSNVPAHWTGEEVLFTLIVQANSSANLSEGLDIGSRYTAAEAYERNSGNLRNLGLVFNEEVLSNNTNELFQNAPNPVRNQTVISFRLADAHPEVIISIRDAAGRIVSEFKQEGVAGNNSLVLDKRMLKTVAGVYSYTVKAGDWVATKRMIMLR